MAEKQDKYIVIKVEEWEHLVTTDEVFFNAWMKVQGKLQVYRASLGKGPVSGNKYIVCNQDEPYAARVMQVILEGEDAKGRAQSTEE